MLFQLLDKKVALPAYQDYVTRSKFGAASAEVASLKLGVAQCMQTNNNVVANCDTVGEINSGAVPPVKDGITTTLTTNTAAIVLTGDATVGSCVVTITPAVAGSVLSWTPVTSGGGCGATQTGF